MAIEAYPFDNSPVSTEMQWSRLVRLFQVSGVDGVPAGTDLKVSLHTGLAVAIAPGAAFVRGVYVSSSAVEYLTLPTNDAAQARIDRIVLRVNLGANTATFGYVQGTPGTSPVPPAATVDDNTGVFELSLATVTVAAANTLTAPVDARSFVGRPIVVCTSQNRPVLDGRPVVAFETDTKRIITNPGSGSWNVGYGDSAFRPLTAYSIDNGTTSSTTYTTTLTGTGTPTVSLNFTAPASGDVLVRIGANLQTSTSAAGVQMSVRLTPADGGAITIAEGGPSVAGGLYVATKNISGSGAGGATVSHGRVFALTPNVAYTATLVYLTTAGTATFDDRSIEVHPLP